MIFSMKSHLINLAAQAAAKISVAFLYLGLPIAPLGAALLFGRWQFVKDYAVTLRKMRVHLGAMSQGPIQHYFKDVLGRVKQIPVEVEGACVQCGNCCMNRQCAFLEPVADDKYQCGIYSSPLRRFSNCGSFPLNQHDIDRYACPSYQVVPGRAAATQPMQTGVPWMPVRFIKNITELRSKNQ